MSGRRLLLTALAAALACAGCASAPSLSTRPVPPPDWPAVARPTPDDSPAWSCEITMPKVLRDAVVAGRVGLYQGENRFLKGVSADGGSVFVTESQGGPEPSSVKWSRLVRVTGAERRTIDTISDPTKFQYGQVRSDGQVTAFLLIDMLAGTRWTLKVWDAITGASRVIVKSSAHHPSAGAPDGVIVHDGSVIWVQAGSDHSEIHKYDVATGKDTIVHTGYDFAPVLFGDTLIWPEADSLRSPPHLSAANVDTGAPVALPPSLRDAADVFGLAAGDRLLAWHDAHYSTLTAWNGSWPTPRQVAQAPDGDRVDDIVVAGDWVSWASYSNALAVDVRTGKCVRLTPAYGYAMAASSALAVVWPDLSGHGDLKASPSEIYVLHVDSLPPLVADP